MLVLRHIGRGLAAICLLLVIGLILRALVVTFGIGLTGVAPAPGSGLVKTLSGHSLWVDSVGWSPDGKLIATGASDGTARIWDAQSGSTVATLTFPGVFEVSSLAWSPDGKYLATLTGGGSDSIQIWDRSRRQRLFSATPRGEASQISWSPNGKSFAVGLESGLENNPAKNGIDVYDLSSKQVIATQTFSEAVSGIAWSPDAKSIAFTASPYVAIWHLQQGTQTANGAGSISVIADERVSTMIVDKVSWSKSGTYLAYGTAKGVVVWNVPLGKVSSRLPDDLTVAGGLAWSPDGTRIAAGTNDSSVVVWNMGAGGARLAKFPNPDVVNDVAWSPDGTLLASACSDHKAYIWSLQQTTQR